MGTLKILDFMIFDCFVIKNIIIKKNGYLKSLYFLKKVSQCVARFSEFILNFFSNTFKKSKMLNAMRFL